MILTGMRGDSTLTRRAANEEGMSGYNPDTMDKVIFYEDEDYETAEIIGNKMLMHMAAAYRMIDGEAQECVPEIMPLDQRKVLFEQLKAEYNHKELIEEGKIQGISRATILRWNERWLEEGLIVRIHHGQYQKVA